MSVDSGYESNAVVRAFAAGDECEIVAIYNWYIAKTVITFEEQAISATEMAARIRTDDETCPWFVIEVDNEIQGYAYATLWKTRTAYRNSRETSIYLHHAAAGKGFGKLLYKHLINELRKTPIHLLIGGIALPNAGSVALHESLGFTPVGKFCEVGRKFGNWVDVGYWQLNLEN